MLRDFFEAFAVIFIFIGVAFVFIYGFYAVIYYLVYPALCTVFVCV